MVEKRNRSEIVDTCTPSEGTLVGVGQEDGPDARASDGREVGVVGVAVVAHPHRCRVAVPVELAGEQIGSGPSVLAGLDRTHHRGHDLGAVPHRALHRQPGLDDVDAVVGV